MTAQAAGEIDGVALAPKGTWKIDEGHTTVGFSARHMLTKIHGRFNGLSGLFEIAEMPEDSSVKVEIDAGSIESNNTDRDAHLKSPDFLDVERFPKLTFRSTGVRLTGGGPFQVVGDLTIKDVTREVVLDAEYLGSQADPFGNTVAAFSARTEIDREDFGMTWNVVLEAGSVLVSKKVEIRLEIEAHKES